MSLYPCHQAYAPSLHSIENDCPCYGGDDYTHLLQSYAFRFYEVILFAPMFYLEQVDVSDQDLGFIYQRHLQGSQHLSEVADSCLRILRLFTNHFLLSQ